MKYKLLVLFFAFSAVFQAFAQADLILGTNTNSDLNTHLMLARSSADYRVTPGDVYTLAYAVGNNQIAYPIVVDISYRIRISNLGIVNGAGKTFLQLKNEVEAIVTNNYPLSGVQLIITQPSFFNVHVRGEVRRSGEVPVWALSRLSSLLTENNQTPYSSVRDVSVRSSNGQTRVYDLFNAQRLGDLSQDPYLRPGDVVTFNRVKRVVTISGSVERPGTYQLLDGENITELINTYGSGLTSDADRTRIEMIRLANNEEIASFKLFLTASDLEANYPLENRDNVTIPSTMQLQAVMFVEGAVGSRGAGQDLTTSSRMIERFNRGETYASLIRRNIGWFSEVSDTQNAYIIREGQRILINLNLALYDATYRGDLVIHENDVLVIPFRQYFVSVAGAVARPGRYPYIPDRDWEYYIGLAGGFVPGTNFNNSIGIMDINGKRMNKTDIITPETTITANTNHFLFYFNQYAPVLITTMTAITTFFTVYQTFQNLR
jgi:protein involved in polysaccharide export with SLBB domain